MELPCYLPGGISIRSRLRQMGYDTVLKNIHSCVTNNDLTTGYLALERGVRQGDPLSPYRLFVVVVKTLVIAIRQNTEIKDISIGKEETKLLQFADDTTTVLSEIRRVPFSTS